MARATPLQPGVNAGELSPRMVARTDFQKYPLGVAILENMLPLPQGGAMRRPGTMFINETADSTKATRLLPFEFSITQAYMVEAGENIFRFYRNQGKITVDDTDAVITNGTFVAGITDWDDRSTGGASIAHNAGQQWLDLVGSSASIAWAEQDVAVTAPFMNSEHVLKFRVTGVSTDFVELRIGTATTLGDIKSDTIYKTGYHAVSFTPGATTFFVQFRNTQAKTVGIDDVSLIDDAIVEVDTPYLEADLDAIKFAQSADVLYLCHPDVPVHKLLRLGNTDWSVEQVNYFDGPYDDENTTSTTLLASASTGLGITITASSDTFVSTDVGRLVRILENNIWGHAIITGFTSATVVTADVIVDFDATPTARTEWRLGIWSDTTGYPAAISFFEQRQVLAASPDRPQTFWMSQSADFESHEPDSIPSGGGARVVQDDDALDYTISADQVNVIRWMAATSRDLVLGTVGGEWTAISDGPLITPTDIEVKRRTAFGSANIAPANVRGRLLYVQRAARKVLEFTFSFELDNFQSLDQTLLAEHITRSGIRAMAYQQELDSTLWCARVDGEVPTLTFQPDQNVVGWARQIIGGSFNTGKAVVESVAVIPGTGQDEIWMVVKRTVNGATKRYIEVLHAAFETGDPQEGAFFADSGLELNVPIAMTGATQANPVVITATAHGLVNGDRVRITDVLGMTELNGNSYTVAGATANTLELNDADGNTIDGTGFSAYVIDGDLRKKVTTVSGLTHLEGETVKVLADGAVHPDRVVTAGSISLQNEASRVVAGLGYKHVYGSLKWDAGSRTGTSIGQVKRIDRVTLVLLDSLNSLIGPNADELKPLSFRETDDFMDQPVPLFTGEFEHEFLGDHETDPRIRIEGEDPVPFTLLAVAPRLETEAA